MKGFLKDLPKKKRFFMLVCPRVFLDPPGILGNVDRRLLSVTRATGEEGGRGTPSFTGPGKTGLGRCWFSTALRGKNWLELCAAAYSDRFGGNIYAAQLSGGPRTIMGADSGPPSAWRLLGGGSPRYANISRMSKVGRTGWVAADRTVARPADFVASYSRGAGSRRPSQNFAIGRVGLIRRQNLFGCSHELLQKRGCPWGHLMITHLLGSSARFEDPNLSTGPNWIHWGSRKCNRWGSSGIRSSTISAIERLTRAKSRLSLPSKWLDANPLASVGLWAADVSSWGELRKRRFAFHRNASYRPRALQRACIRNRHSTQNPWHLLILEEKFLDYETFSYAARLHSGH